MADLPSITLNDPVIAIELVFTAFFLIINFDVPIAQNVHLSVVMLVASIRDVIVIIRIAFNELCDGLRVGFDG